MSAHTRVNARSLRECRGRGQRVTVRS
jgi:hypothetical protein